MTTLFIDSATQSVYTDSRGTSEDSQGLKTLHTVVKGRYFRHIDTIITGCGCLRLVECAMFSGGLPEYYETEFDTNIYFVTKQVGGLLVCKYKPKPSFFDLVKLTLGFTGRNYERTEFTLQNEAVFCAGSGLEFAYAAHLALQDKIQDKESLVQEVYRIVASFDSSTDDQVVKYSFDEEDDLEEDEYAFGL